MPKGRRVLLIYDKAGLDFAYWKRCRQECAVYFLSRVKEGMVSDWLESRIVDHRDQRNRGVTEDRVVMTGAGGPMRIIYYRAIHFTQPARFAIVACGTSSSLAFDFRAPRMSPTDFPQSSLLPLCSAAPIRLRLSQVDSPNLLYRAGARPGL